MVVLVHKKKKTPPKAMIHELKLMLHYAHVSNINKLATPYTSVKVIYAVLLHGIYLKNTSEINIKLASLQEQTN